MNDIIAADIGGTNARFARARLDADGVPTLGTVRKYKVADYPDIAACWRRFAADEAAEGAGPLPAAASIALATAITGETIKLTNSNWVFHRATLAGELGLRHIHFVNDFEAVAHGITRLSLDEMPVLFGGEAPLPRNGTVTVLGPGTGLGVAILAFHKGRPLVIATESPHVHFAPLDAVETAMTELLRGHFGGRVSNERIVSGPGLANIHRALAQLDGELAETPDDAGLWQAALAGDDPRARASLDRLCLAFGAITGDLALAHGSHVIVLAGGLMQRLRHMLVRESGFYERFVAKGRFEAMMRAMTIRLVTHDEIGLFGAASAYREENDQ